MKTVLEFIFDRNGIMLFIDIKFELHQITNHVFKSLEFVYHTCAFLYKWKKS